MKHLNRTLLFGILLFGTLNSASAQRYRDEQRESTFFFGPGTGLDFGGLGFKLEGMPIPYLGIFGGVGFNFKGLGFNGGLSFKALPFKRLSPTIQAMYGYNAVIIVKGTPGYDKTYYGPSVGAGLDWKVGRKPNKFFFGVYYPFRSSQYYQDVDDLKNNPWVKFENEPLPIALSLGFHFGF